MTNISKSGGNLANWTDKEKEEIGKILSARFSGETKRAYKRDFQVFREWFNGRYPDLVIWDSDPEIIAQYILYLKGEGYAKATIQRRVYGVSKAFKEKGFDSPVNTLQIQQVMKGYARLTRDQRTKQAPPIRADHLEEVLRKLYEQKSIKALRDRTILLIGWIGAFRRSELVSLKWENVGQNEQGITIFLENSKTDQEGKGGYKAIPYRGAVSSCPVRTLEEWRGMFNELRLTTPYIFPEIKRGDVVKDNPLHFKGQAVNVLVKKYFGKEYTAHSLRAGFVTEAARKGASLPSIMQQTHHKDIYVVMDYVRGENIFEGNAALKI